MGTKQSGKVSENVENVHSEGCRSPQYASRPSLCKIIDAVPEEFMTLGGSQKCKALRIPGQSGRSGELALDSVIP